MWGHLGFLERGNLKKGRVHLEKGGYEPHMNYDFLLKLVFLTLAYTNLMRKHV